MDGESPIERYGSHLLEDSDTRIRFQHDYTLAGFKTLFLLQGGAIVALLTYAGHNADNELATRFTVAFLCYVAGLALTVLGYLFAYLSQGAFANHSLQDALKHLDVPLQIESTGDFHRQGVWCVRAAIAGCLLSLIAFLAGCWFAYRGLS